MRRLCWALLPVLLLGACATPPAELPRLAAPSAQEPPHLRVFAPKAPGRHEAVLLVPGCDAPLISARSGLVQRYAERLRGEGYVSAILNYDAGPDCIAAAAPAAIAAEAAAALTQLARRPDVNSRRLHIVGWSWGGRGVLDLVMAADRPAGLVSAVALYPMCPPAAVWQTGVTLQLLLAEKDEIAPPKDCLAWANKSDGPGPIAIHRYVGVGHGFDVDEAGDPQFVSYRTGTPLTFDASTAYQAWLDLLKFLKLDLPAA